MKENLLMNDEIVHLSTVAKIKTFFYPIFSSLYKFRMNIIHPVSKIEKKYKVSIVGIFKDEAPYLKEWVEYNRIAGIEHFYLYNNNSSDNYEEVLTPYVNSGIVTLLQWPKEHSQLECYCDAVNRFKSENQWIGFIDIDEFIVPCDFYRNSVYDYLSVFEKNRGSVIIYWKMFGSSGLISRDKKGLVCEDFVYSYPKTYVLGKCFYNTNYDFCPELKYNSGFHHYMWTKYNGRKIPPVNMDGNVCIFGVNRLFRNKNPIQINHYFTKSYDEYMEKHARGDVFYNHNHYDDSLFYRRDLRCSSVDYSIYRFLTKLKLKMGQNESE